MFSFYLILQKMINVSHNLVKTMDHAMRIAVATPVHVRMDSMEQTATTVSTIIA